MTRYKAVLPAGVALVCLAAPLDASAGVKSRMKAQLAQYLPDAPCGGDSLQVSVRAKLRPGTGEAAAKRAMKRFAPRGAGELTVGGSSFTVRPQTPHAVVGREVFWVFKEITRGLDASYIGQRAQLRYSTRAGDASLSAKVEPGACG